MDQYLSTVVIALITGIFSVITVMIQKKQDKVITKIDEQTAFIEKEKVLKQQLTQKEKEREVLMYQIQILILDTNLYIFKNTNVGGTAITIDDVMSLSEELKKKYDILEKEIGNIRREYQVVLDLTNEIQREVEHNNHSHN